jgi:hypothetical protein
MRLYGTEYRFPHGHYVSHVWARSRRHAADVMRARRLGEQPNGWTHPEEPRPSWLFRRFVDQRVRKKPPAAQVMHALVHLAHLAVASRACGPNAALRDGGWLHEAAHRMQWTDGPPPWRPYFDAIVAVEREIPGYLHPTRPHPNYTGMAA